MAWGNYIRGCSKLAGQGVCPWAGQGRQQKIFLPVPKV